MGGNQPVGALDGCEALHDVTEPPSALDACVALHGTTQGDDQALAEHGISKAL